MALFTELERVKIINNSQHEFLIKPSFDMLPVICRRSIKCLCFTETVDIYGLIIGTSVHLWWIPVNDVILNTETFLSAYCGFFSRTLEILMYFVRFPDFPQKSL